MRTFICTVGTSIVTNDSVRDDSIYDLVLDLDKLSVDANTGKKVEKIKSVVQKAIDNAKDKTGKQKELSAEIKSLLSVTPPITPADEVILLYSDNKLGQVCAEMLGVALTKWLGCSNEKKRIPDLQVRDFERFSRKGIRNLYEIVISIITSSGRGYTNDIFFNITGGYKVVVPYLTLLGMLYHYPIIYIFEDSSELITLPALPLRYDDELMLRSGNFLKMLYADVLPVSDFPKELETDRQALIPAIIEESDGFLIITAFGELLYQRFVQDYPEDLPKCFESPEKKKFTFKDGEDKPPLVALAARLIRSPYVCGIVNSLPFHPGETNRIRPNQSFENGLVEIILPKTDRGLGMIIQTPGRTSEETKRIAALLAKDFKW